LVALVLPLLLLVALEVALRIGDYGYPTEFARRQNVGGRAVFVDNERFTERFFPPGLSRAPHPFSFPASRPENTTRIFVLGESAAMGDPEPAFGFARMLESHLKTRYPGRNFEVLNAGVTAINSHVIREIARDLAPRKGDVWIIYMGNNEVVGPFGAGTIFGAQTPDLWLIRATLAFKKVRLGQFFESVRYRLTRKSRPATWEGMEMFLRQQIAADDPRMAKVYAHFETNLREIIEIGSGSGAKIILSTVASNLKNCPPFASLHGRGFSATNEWQKHYQDAIASERESNYVAAASALERAAAMDPRHAELEFRRAQLSLMSNRLDEAATRFRAARDLDALRFRADTRINTIIRATAVRQKVALLDAVALIDSRSTNGIAGHEFLYEHVHLNFAGNYLMARSLADSVASALQWPPPSRPDPALAEWERLMGFTIWDQLQLAEEMTRRLSQPPFTHQLNHSSHIADWNRQRDRLKETWTGPAFEEAVQAYRRAVTSAPGDWLLRENFAKVLQSIGEARDAEKEWRAVTELMPHYASAWYSLGDALDAQGKSAEALKCFRTALNLKPNSVEARNGIGLALASQGKREEALKEIRKALDQKPDFAEARVNLGQLLAEQGRIEQAKAEYAMALKHNSNSAAAHINLGKLLAQERKYPEAIQHYTEALRINPHNAVAHYNLGNALAATGGPDAEAHFAQAAQINPDFAEARYNLALQMAKKNRNSEALAQFAEVVRLKPAFAEAHLNYGVSLAKARRFDEALQEFETTLRLEPGNDAARKFLEQARAAQRSAP
jgi:tetratricopeptide (TPR) repeat protein